MYCANEMVAKILIWLSMYMLAWGRPDIVEEEILDEILYNYNKIARPATTETPVVTVSHGINLIKIEECDGKTLKAMTWLPIAWVDPRLEWSVDYYDLDAITLPSDLIWTPDIVLYNSPASHAGNVYNPRAYVFNSGSVSWYPPTMVTTSCETSEVDPDTIFCLMRFGSWSYSGKSLDIRASSDTIMIDEDFVEHHEWKYVNSTVYRIEQKFECCPETYPNLIYNMTLTRVATQMEQSDGTELFAFGVSSNKTQETGDKLTSTKMINDEKDSKDSDGK